MRFLVLAACLAVAACGNQARHPADISLGQDACAQCRMTLLSLRTAAQIVGPGREPVLFDEIGCLRNYLAATPLPADVVVFVADHRTMVWVDARLALFTRTSEPTPMASGLLAHADAGSREADPAAHGGIALPASQILTPAAGEAKR